MNGRGTPPLVITGFMGAGKTSVGKVVADRLGREFVDMDVAIEEAEGMSVSKIFENRGEAYFRERESEMCARLAARENLIISTGGGVFVNPANRELFKDALVVCLDADSKEIFNRLKEEGNRPLLKTPDPYQRIVELMDARRSAYSHVEWHLSTNARSVAQVADEIVGLLQPKRINVSAPDSVCPIFVGAGILGRAGNLMDLTTGDFSPRCAIVSSPRVAELHAGPVMESLRSRGFEPELIVISDGEKDKTLDSVRTIYDRMVDARIDRHSLVFALGGGVIGDVAGFAAATYLRGVSLVQMPTTLLAMVDASIGGKVAVDHPRGRNLVGAFKLPFAVIADTEALATLPGEELHSGMAEVVKHGIIGDAGLFELLERDPASSPVPEEGRRSWIVRAMQVKIDIVARDPLEQGERGKLNLGHTFGHAFEQLSGYALSHGEAVAIGIVCAARLAAAAGRCEEGVARRIEALLGSLRLPTRIPASMSTRSVLDAMATDKKRIAARQRFVLPRAIGEVEIVDDVDEELVRTVIEASRE
ncbi:MAG TPA: 3-dehydroquinate synthase [Rectinemataceae bacterium]|nr:3-dehydroquinate synthase [Rectinemataceae bacterium]